MLRLLLPMTLLALAACALAPSRAGLPLPWDQSRQAVVVSTAGWNEDHGMLRRFVRDDVGGWQPVGEARPVMIGRNGSGWGFGLNPAPDAAIAAGDPIKTEGDGREIGRAHV